MTTSPAQLADSLDRSKTRFIDVDGFRTRVYEDGQGETMVLLHGGHFAFLCSLDCWSLNLPSLAERFHVVAWDKLGNGFTDNPRREEDYTFEALFQHTLGALRALGVARAHFVGHSRGGFLALRLAIEHPEMVQSLVIIDSNTSSPDPGGSGDFYSSIERTWPDGPITRAHVRMEPEKQAYGFEQITDDYVDRMYEIGQLDKSIEARRVMGRVFDSVWMASLSAQRDATFQFLQRQGLQVRTLLIWGYNDKPAPLRQGLQLMDSLFANSPRAEMTILNGAGHYTYRERPADFNRIVTAFCAQDG